MALLGCSLFFSLSTIGLPGLLGLLSLRLPAETFPDDRLTAVALEDV